MQEHRVRAGHARLVDLELLEEEIGPQHRHRDGAGGLLEAHQFHLRVVERDGDGQNLRAVERDAGLDEVRPRACQHRNPLEPLPLTVDGQGEVAHRRRDSARILPRRCQVLSAAAVEVEHGGKITQEPRRYSSLISRARSASLDCTSGAACSARSSASAALRRKPFCS